MTLRNNWIDMPYEHLNHEERVAYWQCTAVGWGFIIFLIVGLVWMFS